MKNATMAVFAAMAATAGAAVVPTSPADGENVTLLTEGQRDVIAQLTYSNRMERLKERWIGENAADSEGQWGKSRPLVLRWRVTDGEQGPWKIEVGKRLDMSDARVWLVADIKPRLSGDGDRDAYGLELQDANLEVGETYHWRVWSNVKCTRSVSCGSTLSGPCRCGHGRAASASPVATFRTDSQPPRWIALNGRVGNVRDLGGWRTHDGRRVRQGMAFRGQGLNDDSVDGETAGRNRLTVEDIVYLRETLKIRTDLDLRTPSEVAGMKKSPIGDWVAFIRHPSPAYAGLFSEDGRDSDLSDEGKKTMAANFRIFCDERNYPIFFHCIGGTDRTGSLAYVLNAVLGVDRHDLEVDWESTLYPNRIPELMRHYDGRRGWRSKEHFDEGFAKYGDENMSWNDRVVLYLMDCGITKEEIERFRSIMLETPSAVRASWIAEGLPSGIKTKSEKNCPVFLKRFTIGEVPQMVPVRVTGLGFFELEVNGVKLGDQSLVPAACDFTHKVYFHEWDAAPLLKRGENELRITCAPGYSDDFCRWGWRRIAEYPKRAWMELDIGKERVVTDSTWQYSPRSKVTSSSIYFGERQDLAFTPSEWRSVKVIGDEDLQEITNRVEKIWHPHEGAPELVKYDGASIRYYDPRPPKSVMRRGAAFIVDAGINRAGVVELNVKGSRGDAVKVYYAEDIDPKTGDIDARTTCMRDLHDEFALAGDPQGERLMPRFTYHGFRFCRVEGVKELGAADVVCWAFGADVETTGSFECSDPVLNRIHAAAKNSMRSNFASYPTDCCMRKERTPCQMDSMVYEETAMFNFDLRAFYRTWLDNIALGSIGGTRNPDWMGDGVVLPWRYYMFYGDRTVLERNYPFAKRKLDLMLEENPDCVVTNGFGDWCAPNDGSRNYASAFSHVAEVNTAMLGHCCDVMARTAAELGLKGDAERYRAAYMRTKDAYNARFFDAAAGSYSEGDQLTTSLAIAMGFAEGESKDRAYRSMIGRIRGRDSGKLTVGIFGLRYMGEVMADGGDGDLFISMIKGPAYPSFGYMFEQLDATSLWEQWHPYGGMTSHNHAMMSGVETWFFTRLLGISVGDGGASVEVKPVFPDSLEWARGSVRLPCGIVDVEWHRENGKPVCRYSVRKKG